MSAKILAFVPFRMYVLLALSINLVVVLLGILAQNILPPEIPLFYGLATGRPQLFTSLGIIIPATISTLIIVTNVLLVRHISEDFAQKALVLTAIATAIFSTITTLKIILLVGSL